MSDRVKLPSATIPEHTSAGRMRSMKAELDRLPRGVLGYAEVTANQTGIGGTEVDLDDLEVTVDVGANRLIVVSARVRTRYGTGEASAVTIRIKEGTTQLAEARRYKTWLSNERLDHRITTKPFKTSAGPHTYRLTAVREISGANNFATENGAGEEDWIKVEDVGPA